MPADRINLTQLREQAFATPVGATAPRQLASINLPTDTLLALITATEAARDLAKQPYGQIDGRTFHRLREALAPFTTK